MDLEFTTSSLLLLIGKQRLRSQELTVLRVGHSEIPEKVTTAASDYTTENKEDFKDNFFDPHLLHEKGAGSVCRGAAQFQGLNVGPSFGKSVGDNLLKHSRAPAGLDLFAINIARGRDHGLQTGL